MGVRSSIHVTCPSSTRTVKRTRRSWAKVWRTGNGFIGLVPLAAREGNVVCCFEGNTLPFMIRRCEKDGHRRIGDRYIITQDDSGPRSGCPAGVEKDCATLRQE